MSDDDKKSTHEVLQDAAKDYKEQPGENEHYRDDDSLPSEVTPQKSEPASKGT